MYRLSDRLSSDTSGYDKSGCTAYRTLARLTRMLPMPVTYPVMEVTFPDSPAALSLLPLRQGSHVP